LGVIAVIPVLFLSVEHLKLEEKYGKEKGLGLVRFSASFRDGGSSCFG